MITFFSAFPDSEGNQERGEGHRGGQHQQMRPRRQQLPRRLG